MPERFDLHARNIVYTCTDGAEMRTLLEIAELNIAQGTLVSVQGTSGAGKTTLLKVLSGIVRIDNARICWGKTDLTRLSENQRDEWRGTHCGFLFRISDSLTDSPPSKTCCCPKHSAAASAPRQKAAPTTCSSNSTFLQGRRPCVCREEKCNARL